MSPIETTPIVGFGADADDDDATVAMTLFKALCVILEKQYRRTWRSLSAVWQVSKCQGHAKTFDITHLETPTCLLRTSLPGVSCLIPCPIPEYRYTPRFARNRTDGEEQTIC